MGKLTAQFNKFIDSPDSLDRKLLNLFLISLLVGGVPSTIISIALGTGMTSNIILTISMVYTAVTLVIENKFKHHEMAGILTVFGALFFFIILFYTSGGVSSGMSLWILLVLIVPFVFLQGRLSIILFCISLPILAFSIIYSTFHPEFVKNVYEGSHWKIGIDVAQSMMFVGIIIVVIYKFQTTSYKRQNKKIQNAYDEVKKATEAKSTFLSNMSHDIRTPMNAIIGFTRIAQQDIDNKESVQMCLEKIATSSEYLLSLINDVLDMQKIEQGKTTIEKIKFNLGKTIFDIEDILEYQIRSKNCELKTDFSEMQHYIIENDMILIKKILMNLISNAAKYSKEAGGKIYIKVSEEEKGNNIACYTISIRDEGKGISPYFIDRIFNPFEREKDTTTSGIVGTGLGLAITKSAVETLGGTIDVKSVVNEGSEFIVKLDSKYFNEETELKHEVKNTVGFEGKRILMVEDNELNREIASRLLSDIGFKVECAVNGQEAVDKLVESNDGYYDLIYMDIMMPVLNGYDATYKIRNLESEVKKNIPIIAMTANAFDEDVKKSTERGMNGHIAKPFSVDEIVRETSKVLSLVQNR
ncbi:MAG: response regulator [Treponema sp.]|uniref:ATP-binding protein n=1 Tax=Treponema sp. TaxID=166 RepID=UPI00298DB467|nr:ATP-binding protein [Treponema sp.]MCQ2601048.1 response regulator [Treponema sp.]